MRKTYFVSGHLDLTEEEFKQYYEQKLFDAVNEEALFVVGDGDGADSLAQKYLKALMADVTVYHIYDLPKYCAFNKTVGGFTSYDECNIAMTENSTHDIAWVRPGKEKSDTAMNLKRRSQLNVESTSNTSKT
jgi:hypothetical protein